MATPEHVSELLVRVAAGDREALTHLYAATWRELFGVVLHILANRADAEDVLQDVYVRIWRSAHTYKPSERSPMAWLSVVARNRAIDRIRHRKRTHTESIDRADDVADRSPSLEDAAVSASFRRKITLGMRTLPPSHASAVMAVYLRDRPYAEVAACHGVPLNTMRTQLRRSLLKLRRHVET